MNERGIDQFRSGSRRTAVGKRRRRSVVIATTALAATAISVVPASSTIGPAGVRPGKSITVFHNIDFVAAIGYRAGSPMTVRVVRNGVTIGTASGPAISGPEGAGLEVNHGPEGAPRPGDCWTGQTPDIQPGDHVFVTDGAGRDEVIVDEIRFTGTPQEAANGDVTVDGVARFANGNAIPVNRLDSAEFRDGSDLRAEGAEVVVEARAGEVGAFTVRYPAPFNFARNRAGLTEAQIRQRLLTVDGHAIGFGHVAPPPREAMLFEGLTEAPGPAPGCEAAEAGGPGVTSASPAVINRRTPATRSLLVAGLSNGASEVVARLQDANTTVTAPAVLRGTGALQTWRASFANDRLNRLSGSVRVSALIDGVATRVGVRVVRDVLAPRPPAASLRAGTYRGTQRVSLTARQAGDRVRYTIGNGGQKRPTARRGTFYRGRQLVVSRTRVLKMVAIDRAGNASALKRIRYRIR
jgi:hypothetical protein